MHSKGPIFRLKISSRIEELDAVRTLVGRASQAYDLSEDMTYWMELTITESMINAIRHGNQCDPTKEATLKISRSGRSIEIVVEDQGAGFRLDEVADPTDVRNLLKPSGRGILIIRSFMDEVNLSRRPGGGTRLTMVKKLAAGSA
ncbi:MAG TPA: ATP-binding protein [Terriglobia bacterium]|nr:ATP-binding protein [Terriglobia bacterium]